MLWFPLPPKMCVRFIHFGASNSCSGSGKTIPLTNVILLYNFLHNEKIKASYIIIITIHLNLELL